jgi:uncharacterized protein involved in exopolysaccharide biosynthesis
MNIYTQQADIFILDDSLGSLIEKAMVTTRSNEARARAEASFRKEERAKEGAQAMMEYQANNRMIRERTARLKALRLAKEAAAKERGGSS